MLRGKKNVPSEIVAAKVFPENKVSKHRKMEMFENTINPVTLIYIQGKTQLKKSTVK